MLCSGGESLEEISGQNPVAHWEGVRNRKKRLKEIV